MDPAQWLADYNDRLARVKAGAEAASERLEQAGATATTPRGEVTVTVSSTGALEDVKLTPAARSFEADHLARLIVATARQARQAAGAQVAAIMTEYLGDGDALAQITAHQPAAVVR